MHRTDVIVAGLGGFGSGTFYHLARRGFSVVGLERFGPAHAQGSSHGESRIIRKAYIEHPDYIPLVVRAFELWEQLQQQEGTLLMHRLPLVLCGPPAGEAIAGSRLAAARHGIDIRQVARESFTTRFPGLTLPEGHEAVVEPDAGCLRVEECVQAHIAQGQAHGGQASFGEALLDWTEHAGHVRVRTTRGVREAGQLILTAGAWTSRMAPSLGVPLNVVRKSQVWFRSPGPHFSADSGSPLYYYELGDDVFYGFPSLDGQTFKVAQHSGGEPLDDPLQLDRELHPADVKPLREFLQQCIPAAGRQPVKHAICMYTHSPDHHFIVDRVPGCSRVLMAGGFSGHGFKFTPVLGEALADLATTGATDLPIGFLSLNRPGLQPE